MSSISSSSSFSLPDSQLAVFTPKGVSGDLTFGSFPTPSFSIDSSDILIRIHASSINPLDWKEWKYNFLNFTGGFAVGWDFSGEIIAVGKKSIGGWKIGDEVFSFAPFNKSGTHAQYIVVDGLRLARKPKNISHEQAATLPIAFLSAYDGIFNLSKLIPGQTILISAAAGGVGHFAIQLAKLIGAKVFALTSTEKGSQLVKNLGADYIINYKTQKVAEEIFKLTNNEGVDVVFDPTAGLSYELTAGTIKSSGHFIGLDPFPPASDKPFWSVLSSRGVDKPNIHFADTVKVSTYESHTHEVPAKVSAGFTFGAELLASGRIKVHLEKTLKFGEEVVKELKEMAEGKSGLGKVAVTVYQHSSNRS